MGYTIKIGNAVPYHDKEDGELHAKWVVEGVRHESAPAFGEPTDYTNARWPSYTAWANTLNDLGLYAAFLDRDADDAMMREHPGCVMLTPDHGSTIRSAVDTYRTKVQAEGKRAGFKGPDADATLARAEWLVYWVDWALANCETPAIENS